MSCVRHGYAFLEVVDEFFGANERLLVEARVHDAANVAVCVRAEEVHERLDVCLQRVALHGVFEFADEVVVVEAGLAQPAPGVVAW